MHPAIASITSRGRACISQSTVLHVLRLVHTHYIRPEPIQPLKVLITRRAHTATRIGADEENDEGNEEEFYEEQVIDGDRLIPPPRIPGPLNHDMTKFHLLLGRKANITPIEVIRSDPTDVQLAHFESLRLLFQVWDRAAVEGDWKWLRDRLQGLRAIDAVRSNEGLLALVQSLSAYCATMTGGDGVAALKDIPSTKLGMAHGLRALVYFDAGRYDVAESLILKAIGPKPHKYSYHPAEIRIFSLYVERSKAAGRITEFVDALTSKPYTLYPLLVRQNLYISYRPELAQVFIDALVSIPDPIQWFGEKAAAEQAAYDALGSTSKAGRRNYKRVIDTQDEVDDESEPTVVSSNNIFSSRLKATAAVLFIALTRHAKTSTTALAFFRLLNRIGLGVIPHHAADLCVHLSESEQSRNIKSIHERVTEDFDHLSYQAARRFLKILLDEGFPLRAYKFFGKMLAKFPNMPLKHRTYPALNHAKKGDVIGTVKMLKLAFGANMATNLESLKLLLLVYRIANQPARSARIVSLIQEQYVKPTYLATLIEYYTRIGEPASAIYWFDRYLSNGGQPTVEIFEELVIMFTAQGDTGNVDKVLQGAIDSGLPITGRLCGLVLHAGVQTQDWATVARRWETLPSQLKTHHLALTSILRAFVHLSVPYQTTISLFRRIEKPTRAHWSLAILAACDAGRMDVAEELYADMARQNLASPQNPRPDVYIYSIVMHGYLRLGKHHAAKRVYDLMRERRVIPSTVTFTMILSSFIKDNATTASAEQAHQFARSVRILGSQGALPDRGLANESMYASLYLRLIDVSGRLGRTENAQRYYEIATSDAPTTIYLRTALMLAYRRGTQYNDVLRLWYDLFNDTTGSLGVQTGLPGLPRSNILCPALSIVIDAMGLSHRYNELLQIWHSVSEAGLGLDAGNYNSYAIALLRCGDIHGASFIIDRVLRQIQDKVEGRKVPFQRSSKEFERIDVRPGADADAESSTDSTEASQQENPAFNPVSTAQINELRRAPSSIRSVNAEGRAELQSEVPEVNLFTSDNTILRTAGEILNTWRPDDTAWRPNNLIQALLCDAYSELKRLDRRYTAEDGSEKANAPTSVYLYGFGITLRQVNGQVASMTPRAMLSDLHTRFPTLIEWLEVSQRETPSRSGRKRMDRYRVQIERRRDLESMERDLIEVQGTMGEAQHAEPESSKASAGLKKSERSATLAKSEESQEDIVESKEKADPTKPESLAETIARGRRQHERLVAKSRRERTPGWLEFAQLKRKYVYKTPPSFKRYKQQREEKNAAKYREKEAEREAMEMSIRRSKAGVLLPEDVRGQKEGKEAEAGG